ncbi:unnamed protein product [Moneuplotes crassus]|uniref:Uncharacterized protein n=1 Tax=Euplotes crassus TaxID=5936 RepID=A0AAD2DB65_EUPCR|nr:unnamed protein product [Moneuplotes crassus]
MFKKHRKKYQGQITISSIPQVNLKFTKPLAITKNWFKNSKINESSKFLSFKQNLSKFRILKKSKKGSKSILSNSVSITHSILKENSANNLLARTHVLSEDKFIKRSTKPKPNKSDPKHNLSKKDLKASKKTRTATNFLPHSKDMTGIFQLKTTSNFYKNHKLLASFENTKKRKDQGCMCSCHWLIRGSILSWFVRRQGRRLMFRNLRRIQEIKQSTCLLNSDEQNSLPHPKIPKPHPPSSNLHHPSPNTHPTPQNPKSKLQNLSDIKKDDNTKAQKQKDKIRHEQYMQWCQKEMEGGFTSFGMERDSRDKAMVVEFFDHVYKKYKDPGESEMLETKEYCQKEIKKIENEIGRKVVAYARPHFL